MWGHSSAGRALAWHARGRRFDPGWLHHLVQPRSAAEFQPVLSPSSRGLGHYPFTVATGVRIPVGTPNRSRAAERRPFFFCPDACGPAGRDAWRPTREMRAGKTMVGPEAARECCRTACHSRSFNGPWRISLATADQALTLFEGIVETARQTVALKGERDLSSVPCRRFLRNARQPTLAFPSRSALATTDTELRLIASAAIIGLSSRPVSGYSTPAAIGTPSAL
jgi:hypothetical protein